jgi:pimeloyl-ACP methyl ester carboxylesterase
MPLAPDGASIVMVHGSRVATSVVLFHGYTSVPAQFALIAKAYYDRGYNVWLPRMPYHGLRDRLGTDLSKLDTATLRRWTDDALDVAAGLGDRVEVAGLSGGGTLTVWSSAQRPTTARAVALAPLIDPTGIPYWAVQPLVRFFSLPFVPDHFVWWDSKLKENDPSPGYTRYSFKSIAAYLAMGMAVYQDATSGRKPVDGTLALVTNDSDAVINGPFNVELFKRLVDKGRFTLVQLPADLKLNHDIVGPDGRNKGRIGLSYERIAGVLGVPLPAEPK